MQLPIQVEVNQQFQKDRSSLELKGNLKKKESHLDIAELFQE
jgi:hypothetical protein